MQKLQLTIQNESGLHARPASIFVKKANEFQAEIGICDLTNDSGIVDGKSILLVLSLGVEQGHEIILSADGPDELEAIKALASIVQIGDTGYQPASAPTTPEGPVRDDLSTDSGGLAPGRLQGTGAAPGLAEGRVWHLQDHKRVDVGGASKGLDAEQVRLDRAISDTLIEVEELRNTVSRRAGPESAAIFEAQSVLLNDHALRLRANDGLRRGMSAEAAWQQAIAHFASQLDSLENTTLRMRAADVRDVGRRVLDRLGHKAHDSGIIPESSIIVARELLPSQTASLDMSRVLAICTAEGGPTSHTAILARAMQLPAVVALGSQILEVPEGTSMLVDGATGAVTISPDAATMSTFRQNMARAAREQAETRLRANQPAVTSDGHVVRVLANIASVDQATAAVGFGAEGIGLLRTEFLFLRRHTPPTEDEQFTAYRAILDGMQPRPVVVRTLDVGGDKELPYLDLQREPNPFLGYRGIRVSLGEPELFKTQLRALWRAGRDRNLRIMFPFVSTLEEVNRARQLLSEARQEVLRGGHEAADKIQVGMMIEVPAAVILANHLARQVDFFSIGTNDLTQYTFAADRTNGRVASLQDGCQPAILSQIRSVVVAAHKAGISVAICGELAADADALPILIGLGVDELSMGAASIPQTKAVIRELAFETAKGLAEQAMEQVSAQGVRELGRRHLRTDRTSKSPKGNE